MDSSTLELHPLHRGAEADLFLSELPPWKAVVKRRVRKAYRHEQLDAKIRKERTVKETAAIRDAKTAGARTPSILGLDLERFSIIMTFIDGSVARDAIDSMPDSRRLPLLEELGRQVGFLHSAGIVHGDVTTSNIIVPDDGKPFIIDFGMATKSSETEDRGTDLHLLQRSLIATHALDATDSFKRVAKGYRESAGDKIAESSLRKAAEIARRGRYFAIR
ncbi:MAG TPA: Kae1-associated kinase Bud32 [Candidatus Bathyarchaeia archaeon]|nr:Kae1-associated kinase Bud32 [Candidatus Bathyarchaeia archaeon]